MNKVFCLIFIIFFFSCKEKNIKISGEKNPILKNEIETFLKTKDSTLINYKIKSISEFNYKDFENVINKKLAEKLDVKNAIYKADFDNNGFEDFLVIGDAYWCLGRNDESCSFNPLVILNYNQKNSKIILLSTNSSEYLVPRIEFVKGKSLIAIYKNEIIDWNEQKISKKPLKKLLEYKFGNFIEYKNSNDYDYNIQKIEYNTSLCFGTCPEFEIIIDTTKNATYKAINFNFSDEFSENNLEGMFKTNIKEEDFSKIIELLNHIDFPYLKDEYHVNWTDDQTGTIKIYYNFGKYKEISDYGLQGTKSLELLHNLFFNLRKEQDWKKVK